MPNSSPRPAITPPTDPAADNGAASRSQQWPDAAVLIVDDEPGMRHFLQRTLAPRMGQVQVAGSAEEAETLLQRHRFDLVILDITLPGKTGLALLQEMREAGNACEVVLITAFADLDTAIEALRAGAGDFLLKPFRVAAGSGGGQARARAGTPQARELGAQARARPAYAAGRRVGR